MNRPALRLATATVVLLGTTTAGAFLDTHLNEISAPALAYAEARVAVLEAQAVVTKPEKKERKLLGKFAKKAGKNAIRLKNDFKELQLAAKTAKKLKTAGAAMQDSLDEGFALAELALDERVEFVDDHVRIGLDNSSKKKTDKFLGKYQAARNAADAAGVTPDKRASGLVKAEKFLTKALSAAEKGAQRTVTASGGELRMPLTRLRSGDEVGSGGGRVAIPITSDSPLAGTSIEIPPNALSIRQRITIVAGTDFVGGRDVAAGSTVRIQPTGLQLNQAARVHVRYDTTKVPQENLPDLALFQNTGAEQNATLDLEFGPGNFIGGEFNSLADFQPGLLAPPEGAPSGRYHVRMFSVSHQLDDTDTDKSRVGAGVIAQDFTFRADGSGESATGIAPFVFRQVLSVPVHHIDGFSNGLAGSVDFDWIQTEFGRFQFDLPVDGAVASVEGTVSTDGNVIVFTGRGGAFDLLAVGVREATDVTAQDLDGRWAAVEIGAHLQDNGAEPFTTRWFSSYTGFDFDSTTNELTFHGTGQRFFSTMTYNTDVNPPVHVAGNVKQNDGGTETLTVLGNGQFGTTDLLRNGFVNPASGVAIATHADSQGLTVSLLVAVRQPASVPATNFDGDFRLARIDLAPLDEGGTTTRSRLEIDVATGTYTKGASIDPVFNYDPMDRAVYALQGVAPLGDITWSLGQTLTPVAFPPESFTLSLDAAGNHRPGGAPRFYGVSETGNVLIGTTTEDEARGARGIVIGLK